MRDPATEWREWQKGGRNIEREWTPVYRFERGLSEEQACYYQHAFRVIEDFAEAGSFPGGYTRASCGITRLPPACPASTRAPT
jgi:hypothetical protein